MQQRPPASSINRQFLAHLMMNLRTLPFQIYATKIPFNIYSELMAGGKSPSQNRSPNPFQASFNFVDFPLVPNDNEFRDVFVDMRQAEKWTSSQLMNSLRLDANRGGELGELYFDFIRFREELVHVRSEGDVDEIEGLGSTLQLQAQLAIDLDRSVEFKWSVDKPEIASVDANGLVTALGEGNVVVTASDVDGTGIAGELSLKVWVDRTSVDERALARPALYPNPAGDRIYLSDKDGNSELSILNLNGKLVDRVSVNAADASISIEALVPGMYLLRIEHENEASSYHRFVKK